MTYPDERLNAGAKNSGSKAMQWASYVISGLAAIFLLLDGGMKLFKPEPVVKATVELGYPESAIVPIGIVLVLSTILYLIPRTTVLGAILLTGYLGGAVATHVRAGSGAFPIVLPVILGIMLWGGLYLRDERVARLVPLRSA
jgi:hypothetical protein